MGAVVALVAVEVLGTATAAPTPPTFTYYHNWVDTNGTAHFTDCQLTNFTSASVAPGTVPSWNDAIGPASNSILAILPPGSFNSWHHDPVVQTVFVLSGTGNWTTSDGSFRVLTPGAIYLGEDQRATEGKGHTSETVGDVPLVLMLVQHNDWVPHVDAPCWLQ